MNFSQILLRGVVALAVLLPSTKSRGAETLGLTASAVSVGQFEKIEFDIGCDRRYANAFNPLEVDLSLTLRTPRGGQLRIPAFWRQGYARQKPQGRRRQAWMYPDGWPKWKARFAPTEVGRYEAVAELQDSTGKQQSAPVTFTCVASPKRGFVRISVKDPRFLEFTTGEPYFPIGQNLAFIGQTQYVTLDKVEGIFAKLAANGANHLRIWTGCEDWAMGLEARKSAWGRSWAWRPPIVPWPEAAMPEPVEAGKAARKCIGLPHDGKASAEVSPSHEVALRPETRYRLSGRAFSKDDVRLQVTAGSRSLTEPVGNAAAPDGWQRFALEFTTGADEFWLGRMALHLEGDGKVWIDRLSLTEADGGPELLWEAGVNRPVRGFYNPVDCFMLDQVVEAAERHGQYLRLCLLTRDLYMNDLKDERSPEYQRAIDDAKNFLRYVVARWGYSTHVATWEYFNEQNPGLPTDRFYRELGEYLEQIDVYRHLRSTSTWGPSPKDCRHAKLDVADVHFYLRDVKDRKYRDEAEAALGNAAFLREHVPNKPALIGEFGLADEQWGPTKEMKESREIIDFHNSLWASSLSGVSGTALFWWWDRLDQRDAYAQYRPLADFLAGIPWTTAGLKKAEVALPPDRIKLATEEDRYLPAPVRAVGLQGADRAYLWLFDPRASWDRIVIQKQTPVPVAGLWLTVRGLSDGTYRVEWWDTWQGKTVKTAECRSAVGRLRLDVPSFTRDVACKVTPP